MKIKNELNDKVLKCHLYAATILVLMLSYSAAFGMNVTWKDEVIGKKVITEAGTYTILGTCHGMIHINPDIKGTVTILGPGTLEDIDVDWDKPHVIKSYGDTKVVVDGIKLDYNLHHHKAIDLGPGGIIRNCTILSGPSRRICAGHIEVGVNGLMENNYAKVIDDTYKVKLDGAQVINSTADMMGNGSAITLDWGGASGVGHFAKNCIVEGYSNINPNGDDESTIGNYTALCAISENDCSKIYFTDITIKDGPKFAHIIKICQKSTYTLSDIKMTGTLPDGASQKHKGDVTFSPVVINAGKGTIKDVTINFNGALSNPAWHFLNGKLENVNIDGVIYNGTYNNAYGNTVKRGQK